MFGEIFQSEGQLGNDGVSMLAKRHNRRKFPLTLCIRRVFDFASVSPSWYLLAILNGVLEYGFGILW